MLRILFFPFIIPFKIIGFMFKAIGILIAGMVIISGFLLSFVKD